MRRLTIRNLMIVAVLLLAVGLAACVAPDEDTTPASAEPTGEEGSALNPVTLMLDWVPNTNHTGIFVAQENGYFEDAGLDVEIVQPGEVFAEQAVSSGAADFGVSFQEQVTLSREGDAGLVSVAAVIQHNTSGFASLAEKGVESPADWEGLTYGSFGSPFEEPTLRALMECAGADYSQLNVVDTGFADPLALLAEGQTDLAWIFYGWQGFQAAQQGIDLNIQMMSDYFDCIPDYYTPVIITSEAMIAENPETVRAFVGALAEGYTFAAENPGEAAGVLLAASPELDEALVRDSQAWISDQYIADAAQWGEQSPQVWADYAEWMASTGILSAPIDADAAFTNEFLP